MTNTKFKKIDIFTKGFTIIELIVAITLFIVVSLVSMGSLLSMLDVNRRTQATESVINNLGFALESMSKSIRVGSNYHCGNTADITLPRDCAVAGSDFIAFESSSGDKTDSNDQIVYRLNGNQIERSDRSGQSGTFVGLTAPEVSVTSGTGLRFFVLGSSSTDNLQPRVVIVLGGQVDFGNNALADFNIQTTVSQRAIDE
jgi:type II secretory pathway pseudopilin PulG